MTSSKRPNLLFIIADDLGFSDIGCYGAEIATPNLDALAKDDVRMLNYHTAAASSPTRAMLLTGTDAHLGGLGCLIEARNTERGAQRWQGKPGYEGYLNKDVAPLSEVLEDNGYQTMLSGKWHLGMRRDAGPWARGFQKSFTMLPGCCNHYGWEPTTGDNQNAWKIGGRPIHADQGIHVVVPPNKHEDGFYSSDHYADRMVEYLEERSDTGGEQPFFGYLAYTAPHWPIQCDKKYADKYDAGPYVLRKERLARLIQMGIISPDTIPHDVVHENYSEWDDFNDYERACSGRVMETYAGMIEQMDRSIGRVIDKLKACGEYDNTLIIFMSNNGAEGAAYEAKPMLGDYVKKAIQENFDNSLDNIGRWNSFTWSFTTCMDIYPTFLEMADITQQLSDGRLAHRDHLAHPPRGKSWNSFLSSSAPPSSSDEEVFAIWPEDQAIGWEMHEQAAMRKGNYKIVYIRRPAGGKAVGGDDPNGWELFNVRLDPGETTDISQAEPEIFRDLTKEWETYVTEMGVVWGPDAMQTGLSKEEAPHLHDVDFDLQRIWLQTPHGDKPPI